MSYNDPKKILIAFPRGMREQIDAIAEAEHRTRSDLIREACRRYIDNFRRANGGALAIANCTKVEQVETFRPKLGDDNANS